MGFADFPYSGDNTFLFTQTERVGVFITCPYCGKNARISTARGGTVYTVHNNGRFTSVFQDIRYDERRICLPDLRADPDLYPIKAILIFDHAKYYTLFQLVDRNGSLLVSKDINEESDPLWEYSIGRHINSDRELKKIIETFFCSSFGCSISFDFDELNLERFVLFNRFTGFPRSFYDAIPFTGVSKAIDSSFDDIYRFSDYRNIDVVYINSGLPDKKGIRRIIFEKPALLFYSKELKEMPFRNYDIQLSILQPKEAYGFLAYVHYMPRLNIFLTELILDKGEVLAWRYVQKNICSLPKIASLYMLLPDKKKKELLQGKLSDDIWNEVMQPDFNWITPKRRPPESFNESVGKYRFAVLHSTAEHRKAAKELNNCLADLLYDSIVGIFQSSRYIGAISIEGNRVTDARLSNNRFIEDDEDIYNAFTIWGSRHNLYLDRQRPY